MTRLLRPLAATAALMLVGIAGPAAASTSDGEAMTVQETSVTSAVVAQPGNGVDSILIVALAASIVTGAAGSTYLVRRSRCRTGAPIERSDREVATV